MKRKRRDVFAPPRDTLMTRLAVFLNEYGLVIIIIVGIIAWLLGFNPGPIEDPYGRYVP